MRNKSKVTDVDLINRQQLLFLIGKLQTSNTIRDRALISILYLTGARISEIVRRVKRYDIEEQELDGIRYLVIFNVECLKRRENNKAKRNIPIRVEQEEEFLKYVWDYLQTLEPDAVLFPYSRQYAYSIVREFNDPLFPHWFRHLRCSHLTAQHGINSSILRAFIGWTSDAPASKYVHLNWKDIARSMK